MKRDSQKRPKKKINFKGVIYENKVNITSSLYLHKKGTPHPQVLPVSYLPETVEIIIILEAE